MTIQNRTVTITGVFASNANTTIPASPVAGISYRNTALSSTAVSNGWSFKTIVDSANFNQALYEYSSITKQIETYGFLPWSNLTDYVQGSLCLGSNGTIYQAKQNTGPSSTAKDPTTDSEHTYWDDFVGETYVKKTGTNTITANNTFSGTNTFNGSATFSNSVALGGSATATTQATTNNSTKVATTAFVVNVLKELYPVGSLYIGTQASCPLASFFGTWTLVAQDKALWGGDGTNGNTTKEAGLPNITGQFSCRDDDDASKLIGFTNINGCFQGTNSGASTGISGTSGNNPRTLKFDASRSNAIYGGSSTVQPPAYVVNVWRRTA